MPNQTSATKRTSERTIYPAHGDPIRVVPLNVPQELIGEKAAPGVAPQLTYRNGPLIKNVEIFTIFWETGWQSAPASNLIPEINGFFDYIVTSPLIDQLVCLDSRLGTEAWPARSLSPRLRCIEV
jgi:hypothetical protein